MPCSSLADIVAELLHFRWGTADPENTIGMFGCEITAGGGAACLKEYGVALWRRQCIQGAPGGVPLASKVNLVNLRMVDVYKFLTIAHVRFRL
ncbi:Uncharacterised protein [Mycobacteroides abscessus subsp. abscessus]|nr:Uncharacterised protein [Mycobacteroides abscessus subsp. abscessus]